MSLAQRLLAEAVGTTSAQSSTSSLSWCPQMASLQAALPTPRSRSQPTITSSGVRTQIAQLITVVPPTQEAWTMGQRARPRAMPTPQSSKTSRMAP